MLVIASALAAGTGVLITGALGGGHTRANTTASSRQAISEAVITGTPAAEFRYLAAQNSNRCGLTPTRLQSYPLTQRLQGSCCDPMDLSTYEWQVKALRRYATIPQIPKDPYDVPVSLARQLLGYGNSIRLSAPQQATYDMAMHMSREHGPCCCHCWRWNAFRGMSNFLITHGWMAPRVALIIDDVEGCGGKGEQPRIPSQATA